MKYLYTLVKGKKYFNCEGNLIDNLNEAILFENYDIACNYRERYNIGGFVITLNANETLIHNMKLKENRLPKEEKWDFF